LGPAVIVTRNSGQRGWLQVARRQTDEHRRREARRNPHSRVARLLEVERRFSADLAVEIETNAAYRAYKATGCARMVAGRDASSPCGSRQRSRRASST
jgi:hypothetical protein